MCHMAAMVPAAGAHARDVAGQVRADVRAQALEHARCRRRGGGPTENVARNPFRRVSESEANCTSIWPVVDVRVFGNTAPLNLHSE